MATAGETARQRVVVVGAGFGGLALVRALARQRAAEIVLIDRANHFLFQPLLYQVATAALSATDIAVPVRASFRRHPNVTVVMGEVVAIDTARRAVVIEDTGEIGYDILVVATGAAYGWFGHDAWAADAAVLKTLDDAEEIRTRVLGAFEWAESRSDPAEVRRLTTFVVVGGGPTGVELAGAIAELARSALARDFRRIRPQDARILLCESGPRLLAAFPAPLSDYARRALGELGVEVHLESPIEAIDAEGITMHGGRVAAANVFWCAGTTARPAAGWLGAETARNGAVKVGPDCAVPGREGVFAIGDGAQFTGPDGRPLPGLAVVAKQQGAYVARVIAARLGGKAPPGPFRYRDYGTLAVIGRSRAVAWFGRLRLTGFAAWLAWSLIHLLLLSGFRNRAVVYVNWSWSWLTYGRGARLITGGRHPGRQRH